MYLNSKFYHNKKKELEKQTEIIIKIKLMSVHSFCFDFIDLSLSISKLLCKVCE